VPVIFAYVAVMVMMLNLVSLGTEVCCGSVATNGQVSGFWWFLVFSCLYFTRARVRAIIRGFRNHRKPETGFATDPVAAKYFWGSVFNRAVWGIWELRNTSIIACSGVSHRNSLVMVSIRASPLHAMVHRRYKDLAAVTGIVQPLQHIDIAELSSPYRAKLHPISEEYCDVGAAEEEGVSGVV